MNLLVDNSVHALVFSGKFFTWKKLLFWILLKLRQRKRKSQDENVEGNGEVGGYGRKSRNSIADMEAAQKLDPHPDVCVLHHLCVTGHQAERINFTDESSKMVLMLYAHYLVESYETEIIETIHLISHGVLSVCRTILIFFLSGHRYNVLH